MKSLTTQEIFEKSVIGVHKQGECSFYMDSCRYRTKKGLKCAVGQLIEDEYYLSGSEGNSVNDLSVLFQLKESGINMTYKRLNLLTTLQVEHDDFRHEARSKKVFREEWQAACIDIAKTFNLKMPELN